MNAEKAAQIVGDMITDHRMWIGDDGQPLDYLPEREARITGFCYEVAARLSDERAAK